jgi:simple sugar transport system ATP-binding protein
MPDAEQTHQQPLIALRGISKAFPAVLANDQIDFDIYGAEIHALLGENGAGKSTLMKILFGFYRADAGISWMDSIHILSPRECRRYIGMVFQDHLIPHYHCENIAFSARYEGGLNSRIERRIPMSRGYGLQVGGRWFLASVSEQQKVKS